MIMNIYFAIVSWGANNAQLETVFIGQALNSSKHTVDMRNLPQLTNRPAMSNNIIFHLIYREGQVIAKKERLLMPQNLKQGDTVALDRNSYQGNIHHQNISLNPADPVNFTKYYVGYTTDFGRRACEHLYMKKYKRMFVVYTNEVPLTSSKNIELETINYIKSCSYVPTSNISLKFDNSPGGTVKDYEYLYLCFA